MILQNDFKRQWEVIEGAVLKAVQRVGASGRYVLGQEVESFEQALADITHQNHAVGVANGMDALEIGLRCLGLKTGERVLTTPFSAFATTLAILRAGGIPVFVDVDDSGNIDLEQCREVLQKDRSLRFMLPVHLYGAPLSMEALARLKRDFSLSVVEDCAQAIGASSDGVLVGQVGDAAGTSFYPTKNLGALGDGGALLTSNPALATQARALRNYGQTSLYMHDELGLNSRLDEVHAAILSEALLPNLSSWTEARRQTAQRYQKGLPTSRIRFLEPNEQADAVWHLFPAWVTAELRDNLREHLRTEGIATGLHYPRVIPDQLCLQKGSRCEVLCRPTNARRLASGEVSLPIHPFLKSDEVERVIKACREWSAASV